MKIIVSISTYYSNKTLILMKLNFNVSLGGYIRLVFNLRNN